MPLISVIIPVYNNIQYLEACVKSILRFRSVDLECILVNDGSTDGSGYLCDRIANSDKRVSVIHQSNSGVSKARNNGIKQAKGEYVYFLDSDDICLLDKFNFLSEEYDLIIGEYAIGREDNNLIQHSVLSQEILEISFLNEELKICIGSFIVRRDVLAKNNITFPSDIKYGEDQEFILKMLSNSKNILQSKEIFCLYRSNFSSAMYKISLSRFDVAISRIRLMDYYKSRNAKIYEYLGNKAIMNAVVSVIEGLFRYGMPFKEVWNFINKNKVIQEFLFLERSSNGLAETKEINILKSRNSIKKIQLRVIWDYKLYKLRCVVSKLYHNIIK